MSWSVPRCWPGATVVVVGAGPSLTPGQVDQVRASGARSIVINRSFEMFPDADWLHGGDDAFWRVYPHARAFAGTKTTTSGAAAGGGVELLEHVDGDGFDPDPGRLKHGGNNGNSGICIAAHAGAARVVLIGMDCRYHEHHEPTTSGQTIKRLKAHWHGNHPSPCTNPSRVSFLHWRRSAAVLADELAAWGGPEVLNATPGSELGTWPEVELGEALGVPAVA